MLTRNLLNVGISLFVFILLWFLISLFEMFFGGDVALESSSNPAFNWIHVNSYYSDNSDDSYRLRPDEYEELRKTYQNALSEPDIPKPVMPENPDMYSPVDKDGNITNVVENIVGYKHSESGKQISIEEFEAIKSDWTSDSSNPNSQEAYKIALDEYNSQQNRRRNPDEYFTEYPSHYRNLNDFSEWIREDEYNNKVQEYEEYIKSNSKDAKHDANVPNHPIDWSKIYFAVEDSEKIEVKTQDEYGNVKTSYYASVWRSVLDGTEISYDEMDSLMTQYNKDMKVYKEASLKHLEEYHPKLYDQVVNGKKTLNLGFTKVKFLISFIVVLILFNVLYALLSRNLKAQNLLSDTSDINQYHNDQHVALPEEVQRNYDWFPDVGAHSAVQVSSMISHMALLNKGLKQVELAERAKEDKVDENGDIEYFKGEILEDNDGNPITKTVPMIDEEFMEALFDASGAPKNKSVRVRYDATKIPYNPDGSNRDKLGKYDTVADLINSDWEFPIYEPQRPGGAYIVDTAPVNTMV